MGLLEQLDLLLNPGRLRFNGGLLRDAYLAKAAEAAKGLSPEESKKLGLVDDSVGMSRWLQERQKQGVMVPKVPRVPGLMMDHGYSPVNMDELLRRAYRIKPWEVQG